MNKWMHAFRGLLLQLYKMYNYILLLTWPATNVSLSRIAFLKQKKKNQIQPLQMTLNQKRKDLLCTQTPTVFVREPLGKIMLSKPDCLGMLYLCHQQETYTFIKEKMTSLRSFWRFYISMAPCFFQLSRHLFPSALLLHDRSFISAVFCSLLAFACLLCAWQLQDTDRVQARETDA